MMNALGIIFTDTYSTPEKNELTQFRTGASLPIGCRFRAIDFILSGLVDADIYTVGILTKQNYGSLVDHLDGGKSWDLARKRGGLNIMTPYSRGETISPTAASGKLDALRSIKKYLEKQSAEYVILAQGNIIANLDFKDILAQHMAKEADITMVCAKVENPGKKSMLPTFNEEMLLQDIRFNKESGEHTVCINCYCMRRDFLLAFLEKADLYDWHDLARDLILRHMDSLRIMGYIHKGYTAMTDTVEQYYKCNMDMLEGEIREDLFDGKRPILTHIHDTVPTIYNYDADVSNCLLADGCEISGRVENSVLFRKVTVEKGAHVENCVIMQGAKIGANAVLKNVICDKNVVISEGAELIGSQSFPYVLKKGAKI